MTDFLRLYNEYEQTRNVCQFCEKYSAENIATRFLLIRSLDKVNLKDIINGYSDFNCDGGFKELTEKAYLSSASISDVLNYIEGQRSRLILQREEELLGLKDVLSNFPVVNCGVRNDKVDDIVKSFVRNKSLKTVAALNDELDHQILPRIRQYSLWSYYNQTSNDVIELFLLKHPKIIPTLRKIHDIDFFLNIEGEIIPFDLKFTHISDNYFDLASQGIIRNQNDNRHDDFYIETDTAHNEVKSLKAFYMSFKRKHRSFSLPNIGECDKNDIKNILSELLLETKVPEAVAFVNQLKESHKGYVPSNDKELHSLEWWNYKYQGERLFCNNNRLFVFLAYKNKFTDGRELKGKTDEIGKNIKALIDNTTKSSIHTIRYHYDKDAGLEGDYVALAMSTIYAE